MTTKTQAAGVEDILVVSGLSKAYNGQRVVDDISFTVRRGEIFGILGPNGAGKTTTLEMIETMRPIDSGSVVLAGHNVTEEPDSIKYLIGVQLQSSAFMDNLKLTELLDMMAATYGVKVDSIKLLEDVELANKAGSYFKTLSGGQKQRFSITTALVNQPQVLFLDEPTTGLDPQARRNLWGLVKSIKKQGITVILTTHYMDEAEKLCDRVAIMDDGKVVALDTPKSLIRNLLKKGFQKEQHVEQADLEDVFIDLTGKDLRE